VTARLKKSASLARDSASSAPALETYGLAVGEHGAEERPMLRAHQHDEVELNFPCCGALRYVLGGEQVEVAEGQCLAFWAARPHVLIAVEPGTRMIWITLPVTLLTRWALPERFIPDLLAGRIWRAEVEAGLDDKLVQRWRAELSGGGAQAGASPALLEIQACLHRLASRPALGTRGARPKQAKGRADPAAAAARHLERMTGCIARRFGEKLTAAEIAREAALHPAYATQLFRRVTGLTLHAYLERQRIAHARQLLATSEAKIIDVAFASGFETSSAFYAAFARQTGESPARYRRRLRAVRDEEAG
jgi:AraC family transcriptional regulator, melibiose operon regulatory protein